MEKKDKWQGKRAITVPRQSDDAKGVASTAAQLDFLKKEVQKVGMTYVDNFPLEGVAASSPAKLEVLEGLFRRKRERDDFDVIVLMVTDRLSRSGGEHGMWFEHEAKRHGLLVYFAGEDLPTGPYSPIVRVAKYESAKEESVGKGRRTAQGQAWARKRGFFRTSGQTPIGCDRLYCGEDDKPRFIIRNLANGCQEQLDFRTREVIGRFGSKARRAITASSNSAMNTRCWSPAIVRDGERCG